jgi:hypothetical protein
MGIETVVNTLAPYPNDFAKYCHIIPLVLCFFGAFGSGIVLITNFGKPNSESAKILLSLCFSDFLFSIVVGIVCFTAVVSGGFNSGWIGCILNYYAIIATANASVITLGVVAWERYLCVCKGIIITHKQVLYAIIAIWTISFLDPAIPLIFGNPQNVIQLESNHWNCITKWYGRDWTAIYKTMVTFTIFFISANVINFSYFNVYKTFSKITKKKNLSAPKSQVQVDNQRRVFTMCVILSSTFMLFWTPYAIKLLLEGISGSPSNLYLTSIGAMLPCFLCTLNPLILIKFDNRVRGYVTEFLGIREYPSIDTSHPMHHHTMCKEVEEKSKI